MEQKKSLAVEYRKNREYLKLFQSVMVSAVRRNIKWLIGFTVVFGMIGIFVFLKYGRHGHSAMEFWVEKTHLSEYLEVIRSRDTRILAASRDPFCTTRYFSEDGIFGKKELHNLSPFAVLSEAVPALYQDKPFQFSFLAGDSIKITPTFEEQPQPIRAKMGVPFKFKDIRMQVNALPYNSRPADVSEYYFEFASQVTLDFMFKWTFASRNLAKSPEKIMVSLTDPIPYRGLTFLKNLRDEVVVYSLNTQEAPLKKELIALNQEISLIESNLYKDSLSIPDRLQQNQQEYRQIIDAQMAKVALQEELIKVEAKISLVEDLIGKPVGLSSFAAQFKKVASDSLDNQLLRLIKSSAEQQNGGVMERKIEDQAKIVMQKEKAKSEKIYHSIQNTERKISSDFSYMLGILAPGAQTDLKTQRTLMLWNDYNLALMQRQELVSKINQLVPEIRVTQHPNFESYKYPALKRVVKYYLFGLVAIFSLLILQPIYRNRRKSIAEIRLITRLTWLGELGKNDSASNQFLKARLHLSISEKNIAIISSGSIDDDLQANLEACFQNQAGERETLNPLQNVPTGYAGKPADWIMSEEFQSELKKKTENEAGILLFILELTKNPGAIYLLQSVDCIVVVYSSKTALRSGIHQIENELETLFPDKKAFAIGI